MYFMDVIRDGFVGVTAIKGKRVLVPCREPLCASRRVRKAASGRFLIPASGFRASAVWAEQLLAFSTLPSGHT